MFYAVYESGLIGALTLASDGRALTGCRFGLREAGERRDDLPVFDAAQAWLDVYFAGQQPNPRELPLGPSATAFQARVREALLSIPYGQTTSYGAIARRIEDETGKRCAAQAVGGAVGRNPLGVIVPCHRVVGADGSLTGFGGGLSVKIKLLEHEGAAGWHR